jgi:hypothetical protein
MANHGGGLKTDKNNKNMHVFKCACRRGETPTLGVLGRLAEADHDVGLSFPSCLESGPQEPNLAMKGHPKGAKDHPRDSQTMPIATVGCVFNKNHALPMV